MLATHQVFDCLLHTNSLTSLRATRQLDTAHIAAHPAGGAGSAGQGFRGSSLPPPGMFGEAASLSSGPPSSAAPTLAHTHARTATNHRPAARMPARMGGGGGSVQSGAMQQYGGAAHHVAAPPAPMGESSSWAKVVLASMAVAGVGGG